MGSLSTIKPRVAHRAGIQQPTATPPLTDPTTISGLVAWYKADALVLNDDDLIATWTDSSGAANHATAGVGVQPFYKTNIQHSLPVGRFDNIDDGMVTGVNPGTAFSVYVVFSSASAASLSRRTIQGSTNWLIGPYSGAYSWYSGTGFVTGGAVVADQFNVASVVQSAGNGTFSVNGAVVGSRSANAPGALVIGAGSGSPPYPEPANGDVGEMLVWDNALTTDHARVCAYLKTRWATP